MSTVKFGIAKEKLNLVVRGEETSDDYLMQLLDPSMLVLSDFSKELQMDVLHTARKSLLDNFRAVKRLFHEINEINGKMNTLETEVDNVKENDGMEGVGGGTRSVMSIATLYTLEAKVLDLDDRVLSIENTLKEITDKSFKILKASNEHIKFLIRKLKGTFEDKAKMKWRSMLIAR